MIGRVNATDADSPPNANITYKLTLSDSFYIESKSGIIWRSRPLDAGVQTITVLAEDNGSPPMITSRDYVVHIEAVSPGGAVASFAIIGIMSVILIILILALAILGVFFHRKRRERAKLVVIVVVGIGFIFYLFLLEIVILIWTGIVIHIWTETMTTGSWEFTPVIGREKTLK